MEECYGWPADHGSVERNGSEGETSNEGRGRRVGCYEGCGGPGGGVGGGGGGLVRGGVGTSVGGNRKRSVNYGRRASGLVWRKAFPAK